MVQLESVVVVAEPAENVVNGDGDTAHIVVQEERESGAGGAHGEREDEEGGARKGR